MFVGNDQQDKWVGFGRHWAQSTKQVSPTNTTGIFGYGMGGIGHFCFLHMDVFWVTLLNFSGSSLIPAPSEIGNQGDGKAES